MNINEENILEYLGWDEISPEIFPITRTKSQKDMKLFIKNGFIAYQRSYYVVINGKMPIKYAKEMFYNSDNDKLQIRVNSGGHGEPQYKNASHKEMKVFQDSFNWKVEGLAEGFKKFELKQSELIESDPNGFYIDNYHIDTIEGLKVFTKMIVDNDIKTSFIKGE